MNDSRLLRARTLIRDADTILAELCDELADNHLEAAHISLTLTLRHLNILEAM